MFGMAGLLIVGLWAGVGADVAALNAPEPDPSRNADTVRAAELEREAETLFSRKDQWQKAARLLERAAELREPSDTRRTVDLVTAARIHGHLDNPARAERLLTRAAEEAHARGALVMAARAYLDAAEFAVRRGESSTAARLVDRAELLAGSPHLTVAERSSIRTRLPERRTG